MRKLRLGFTLAEVATALLIVGVVAALVMPLVIKSVQKQQTGAILGRIVEQIETGNQNMIQMANDSNSDTASHVDTLSMVSLRDIGGDSNETILSDFKDIVPGYWGLNNTPINSNDIRTPKSYSGNTTDLLANVGMKGPRAICYNFAKFPASACIYETGESAMTSNLTANTGLIIYLDVNGATKRPNCAGKDIFVFDLLNNGHLKPSELGEASIYTQQVVEAGFKVNY